MATDIEKTQIDTQEYRQLVDNISILWDRAKEKAVQAVNSELLDANWQTGRYIVEFEQRGKTRAQSIMDKFCEAICAFANDLPDSRKKGYLLIGANDDGCFCCF